MTDAAARDASAVPTSRARRVRVDSRRLSKWIDGFSETHGATTARLVDDVVVAEAADGSRAWFDVPFPPLASDGGEAVFAALVEHVERQRRVGVLLVRRGGHAVGVFDGVTLIASKVGSSYVQGATKAGGWSQQRFARRRGNQAREAFERAADAGVAVLLATSDDLDAFVCGGDRLAVEAVLADDRLAPLRALRTGPLLTVPDPRLRVLQATPEQFLGVRIAIDP